MEKSWKSLEDYIRSIAQIIWERPFSPERIDGTNFDAVGRISDEEIVVIEITEEFSLEKIRTDISKIHGFKLRMAAESIVAKSYIVLSKEPTPGMIEAGRAGKINVISADTLSKQAFDFKSYETIRKGKTFGSSIEPSTGRPDPNAFVPVKYTTEQNKDFFISDICTQLSKKNRIVLLGDYGTGKSRCTRECFSVLSKEYREISAYPIAINLREHWGAQSGIEIISGHFRRLGLSNSIDKAMQLLQSGNLLLLLDGFDEVGAQTFGHSEEKRVSIREHALNGVKDLLKMSTGGALITGRPHYFNDNNELLNALGLSLRQKSTSILRCKDEFEEDQANLYLKHLNLTAKTPKWLPKKPLMFQIISLMKHADAEKILHSDSGEIGFWGQFIDTVCIRESDMHPSINPDTIRSVLNHLARATRKSNSELGRLTPKDVQMAYEAATGHAPDESGQVMLSRLCTLGRIEPESPDRQFVDPYIIQLLFAECLIDDIINKNHTSLSESYLQPLQPIGIYFLGQWIETYEIEDESLSYIHRDSSANNSQALSEVISALLLIEGMEIDFRGIKISGAEIFITCLSYRVIRNITLSDSIIHHLALENSKTNNENYVKIIDCEVSRVSGLSSSDALPQWIINSNPKSYDSLSNASKIKSTPLPPAQKLFLSIVHKIFFQRGGGRKENSLYKGGFGQGYDRKLINQILQKMVSEGIIEKSKDTSGSIFNPKREYTSRMKAIKDQLTLSKDPLWAEIGLIK